MSEIRNTEPGDLDSAAIRLRALEIVSGVWQTNLSTDQTLDAAKTYAQWIEHGDNESAGDDRELLRRIRRQLDIEGGRL